MSRCDISDILGLIELRARKSISYAMPEFRLFGVLGVIVIPATTILEAYVANPSYDTLIIRLSSGIVSLPVLFYERLPCKVIKNFHWYWVFALTFVLPFNFGLMLLLNAAHSGEVLAISPIWSYQYIVALFFFIQLLRSGYLAIPLWLVSFAILSVVFFSLANPNSDAVVRHCLQPLPVFLTAILAGILTNRNTHVVLAEQLRAAAAIGSNIAHELRTPLASIRAVSRGLRRQYPKLLEGYERARRAGLIDDPISDRRLADMRDALDIVDNEVSASNTIIDMLLLKTSDQPPSTGKLDRFSAAECVEESIRRYPFNNSRERALLRSEALEDFDVCAPKILVVHVLFNLIKNALYYVKRDERSEIVVRTTSVDGRQCIEVHDTGVGISSRERYRLFEQFYTTTSTGEGAGIGLSFCRMVMEALGGEITCESKEGEYTTFRLFFSDLASRHPASDNGTQSSVSA